jgi:hypothetical protein
VIHAIDTLMPWCQHCHYFRLPLRRH